MKIDRIIVVIGILAVSASIFLYTDVNEQSNPTVDIEEYHYVHEENDAREDSFSNEVIKSPEDTHQKLSNYFVNDSLYTWDKENADWVALGVTISEDSTIETSSTPTPTGTPIPIQWKTLSDINYRRRYFDKMEMSMYSPVYQAQIKALNNSEVMIKGYVIPFDEEGELVALSANPYASCYFCGNASPASVISMFLKDKSTRYRPDDFKTFKGKLVLNYDDPDRFYYILEEAEEFYE